MRSTWTVSRAHQIASVTRGDRLRNLHAFERCLLEGRYVDPPTGRVLYRARDAELPGPLPLRFERSYTSGWAHRESSVGRGWSHSLDQCVWAEPGKIVLRAGDGRELEFDAFQRQGRTLGKGDALWDPLHDLGLRRVTANHWRMDTRRGMVYTFERVPGETSPLDSLARLAAIQTPAGHETRLAYDRAGRVSAARDACGRELRFEYDARGLLTTVGFHEPTGRRGFVLARFEYSPEGDLLAAYDATGISARFEYQGHLMVRRTDRAGRSFFYGYDGIGADARCVRAWGEGGACDREFSHDPASFTTLVTRPASGYARKYVAGPLNNVLEATGIGKFQYDDALRVVARSDARGRVTRYAYDARGNLAAAALPGGVQVSVEYDARNRPTRAVDVNGGQWHFRFDEAGQLVEQWDPAGHRTAFEYELGLLRAVVRASQDRTEFEYDACMNVSLVRDGRGNELRFAYDWVGRPVAVADARGNARTIEYDGAGRVTGAREADGSGRAFHQDGEGNLLAAQDAARAVRWSYGPLDTLLTREDPLGRVGCEYDAEGRLASVRNAAGEVWKFTRDALGRVLEERGFDGGRWVYKYAGTAPEVRRLIFPDKSRVEFEYDPAGRPVEVRHADGTREKYAYRADGALMEAHLGDTVVRLERDALGRVVREWQGAHWVDSALDARGDRVQLTSSLGARAAFVRGPAGAVDAVCEGDPSAWQFRIDVRRDAAGTEESRFFSTGLAVQWERDWAGRPVGRWVWRGRDAVGGFRLQWDERARLTSVEDAGATVVFDYDAFDRPIAARSPDGGSSQTRAVDVLGNVYGTPSGGDREYVAGGVLSKADAESFRHDACGRMVSRGLDVGGAARAALGPNARADDALPGWRYRYNALGLLLSARGPGGETVEFSYDAFGRRVSKRSTARAVYFLWDGNALLHEAAGQDPASVSTVTTWLCEPGTQTPLAKIEGARHYAALTDHAGTVLALYDDAGQRAWAARLDLFGRAYPSAGATTNCPWRWSGQYEDEETGLYYNRLRYYAPSLGRYISPCPVGLSGGLNAFRYADNPLVEVNPFALGPARFDAATKPEAWPGADELVPLSTLWLRRAGAEVERAVALWLQDPAEFRPEMTAATMIAAAWPRVPRMAPGYDIDDPLADALPAPGYRDG